jgi:hypothetical protein
LTALDEMRTNLTAELKRLYAERHRHLAAIQREPVESEWDFHRRIERFNAVRREYEGPIRYFEVALVDAMLAHQEGQTIFLEPIQHPGQFGHILEKAMTAT